MDLLQTVARRNSTEFARSYRVLLPLIDHDSATRLLPLAWALARSRGGTVLALTVTQTAPPGVRPAPGAVCDLTDLAVPIGARVQAITYESDSLEAGIRAVVAGQAIDLALLGWSAEQFSPERLFGPPFANLLDNPPCDIAVVRLVDGPPWRRLLLPVRGGPHTGLACDIAEALADLHDAAITVLYASDPRLPDDAIVRASLQSLHGMPRVDRWLERAIPAEQAILAELGDHQALVMGVAGQHRPAASPIGLLAERMLRQTPVPLVLVRRRMSQVETLVQQTWQRQRNLSETVDRWFAENTFSSAEFDDLQRLVALKQQQGLTISLGLPALNEAATIGPIVEMTQRALVEEAPLLDEIVLIDSASHDDTRAIARACGIPVYLHQEILPQYGAFTGKGEALWKSLYVLQGDIVVWVDTDIRNFHPRFVYGVLGPLLRDPRLVYCKGYYRRPIQQGEALAATGGGRVTELVARPLLNLFYPELSGIVQPLAGEYAARRAAIEWMPFFTGYGVETGLLIDMLQHFGLHALAQSDLHQRIHRNQELIPLSKMAFAIIQAVTQRLEQRQRMQLLEPVNHTMKLIQYALGDNLRLEVREIRDHERPPMATIPEYRRLRGLPPLRMAFT